MSCACEHRKMAGEHERMRRLAKATAKLLDKTIALYKNDDGTYGFTEDTEINKHIIEFVSPY